MKSRLTWIITLFLALFIQFSFAQEKTITGVVKDSDGLALPGVNVVIQGTTRGTQTDLDGKFSITASQGQKLVFSSVGSKEQIITVGATNVINVTLQEGIELENVIVEGYRTTARKTSNIAATSITSETIEGRPNASFIQSLQAQVPGLNISTGSGSPGSNNTTVILRGVGSLNGNIEPLYVIDGVPANQDNFRTINPNDIESITVLKDAGATSVYGNRGANGVIVVKTKRGSYNAKLAFKYTSITGFTKLQGQDYGKMNSSQQLALEKTKGVGLGVTLTDQEIANYPINVNWFDKFFRTGISQDHNLSISAGSENLSSYTSLGYFEQEGIVPTTDIKRFTFRNNLNGKSSNGKFTYGTNIGLGFSKRNQLDHETRTDIDGNILQNPLQGSLSSLPYLDPAAYVNGQQLFDDFGAASFGITPYMLMDYLVPGNITNQWQELKVLANANASYKITKDLTLSTSAGVDMTESTRVFARNPQSYLAIVAAASIAATPGLVQENFNRDFGFNNTNRLNYYKTFGGKHTVDVSLMTEYFKAHLKTFAYVQNGLDIRTSYPGAGTGYIPFNPATPNIHRPTVGAGMAEAGLFSYFATGDYDYNSKYGVSASFRRDASFRFVDDNKWGTFWSLSARWNISEEAFMQEGIFDELKLRASYGTAGNQLISGNNVYAGASLPRTLFGTATGYSNLPSLQLTQIGNPGLVWETIRQANVGFDFVIKKRLRGTFDVYEKKTIDLYQDLPISLVNASGGIRSNIGSILNRGIEGLVAYDVFKTQDFTLTINANASYNKNQIIDIPNEEGRIAVGDLQIQNNGDPLFQYFTVRYAGVNPANGNALFLNAAGDLTEAPTLDDRVRTGKNAIPVYQGGFGFDAKYKGFFMTTQFSFVADVYRFDFDLSSMSDPNAIGQFPATTDLLNAWTPDNRNTSIPSLFSTNTAAEDLSDRFLVDASYLRLRFVSVGYDVPKNFLDKTFLSGARFYAQAENILTWSKWRGFDPESNAASTFGGYPTPKILSFGLDLQF